MPVNAYLAVKTKERIQAEEHEREMVKEQILKMTAHEERQANQGHNSDDGGSNIHNTISADNDD